MNDEEKNEAKKEHTARFKEIVEVMKTKEYDLLILDELIATINNGFIELNDVIYFLKNKPETLEVVMTGRNPKGGTYKACKLCNRNEMYKASF